MSMLRPKGKEIRFNKHALNKIYNGVHKVYSAVSPTMGPAGNLVIFDDMGTVYPRSTKDGVTVAQQVSLEDHAENQGASLLIQAANRQVNDSGDGTTLVVVLAHEMIKEGIKAMKRGVNPTLLREGIDTQIKIVISHLKRMSISVDEKGITNVARIATNGNVMLAKLISDAVNKVGKEGLVTKERAKNTNQHEVEYAEGYEFACGNIYREFVNNNKGTCELESPLVIVSDKPLAWGKDLEHIAKLVDKRPTAIFCETIKDEALQGMVNNVKNGYRIIPIRPGALPMERRYRLADIAALTGAFYMSDHTAMDYKDLKEEHLGTCERIVSRPKKTVLFGGDKESIERRVKELKLTRGIKDDEQELEYIDKSIAKLKGGMAIIRVGGSSETEQDEILDRVDDAIHACKSAQEEGIVAGGGVALLQILNKLTNIFSNKDKSMGATVVNKALEAPARKILSNADIKPNKFIDEIKKSSALGYNLFARSLLRVQSMVGFEVIDPTKVLRTGLLNASSVAKMVLQSKVLISDKPETGR